MEFDIRYRDYTFKHSYSEKPDMSEERFREHFHTSYEMLFFVKGNADFMLQQSRYSIKPGSLLIAKPGEYHNIVFKSQDPYERYVIRFDPMSIHHYMRERLDEAESVYDIEGTDLASLFFRMDEYLPAVHEDVKIGVCIGSLHVILAYVVSSLELTRPADYINEESRRIVQYIEQNLPNINSMDDITHALHMSKSSLYKIFSEQFKTPIMTYVRTQKCIAAKRLLENGVPAQEAAERLGFSHYSSFYRDYQKVFHEPPSGKRKEKMQ